MKKIIAPLILVLFNNSAKANDTFTAFFIGAMAGGSIQVSRESALAQLPEELQDWADPKSLTTSRLSEQCGVLTEMKLLRTGRLNYMFLGIRNEKEDVVLKIDRALAKFSNGKERFFIAQNSRSLEVKKNWYAWGILTFPQKSDFKDQQSLDVTIPMIGHNGSCELQAHFQRDPQQPQQEASYIDAPSFILSMGFAATLSRLGRLDSATSGNGTGIDIYLSGFSVPSNGWFLQSSLLNLGSVKEQAAFSNINSSDAHSIDISVGKVWRFFYQDRFTGYINLGPSMINLTAEESGEPSEGDTKTAVGAYASYTVDWTAARRHNNNFRSDISFGVTFWAKYYFNAFTDKEKDVGMIGISLDLLRMNGE